jgi:hypothetical protein
MSRLGAKMEFTLEFEGNEADNSRLDFYDAAEAFSGFQRSLALTTHLVINGEIITQAPALKNASILVAAPLAGSWKTVATVLGTVLLTAGVASKDSVLGHLLYSAYDYVISESLGFHVDYDRSLGQQIEESRSSSESVPRELDEGKFDALIEKTEVAIRDLHRPIAHSGTAQKARLGESRNGQIFRQTGPDLDRETFEYINVTTISETEVSYVGKVSSYNSNTFRGRIYIESYGRPVPFILADVARNPAIVAKIVRSLSLNAVDRFDDGAEVRFSALHYETKSKRLKALLITRVL